jgi:hypothetical protein
MSTAADTSVIAAARRFEEVAQRIDLKADKLVQGHVEVPVDLSRAVKRLKLIGTCLGDIGTREGRDDLRGLINGLTSRSQSLESLLDRWLPKDGGRKTKKPVASTQGLINDAETKLLTSSIFSDIQSLVLRLATPGRASLHGSTAVKRRPKLGALEKVPLDLRVPMERHASYFIPRDDILGALQPALTASSCSAPGVVILHGAAGSGKTQLALEYCRQSQQDGRYAGIFWIEASNAWSAARANIKAPLESWTEPWLMVFDGYDHPAMFPLSNFIPTSKFGHIIVTTRSSGLTISDHIVIVPGVTAAQGLDILISRSGLSREIVDEELGKQIVERLGYLPLAIAQAGAYLGQTEDLKSYYELLENREVRLEAPSPSAADSPEPSDAKDAARVRCNSTRTDSMAWECSLSRLRKTENSDEKVYVLYLLGFFTPWDISESLFASYFNSFGPSPKYRPTWLGYLGEDNKWSTKRFRNTVNEFLELSLISTARERKVGASSFIHLSIHPLAREWILLRLDDATRRDCFATAAQMLAHDILRLVSKPIPIEWSIYLSHLSVWGFNHAKLRAGELPMLLNMPPQMISCAVEAVFARFYDVAGLRSLTLRWFEWVWKKSELETSPWPAIRFAAGCGRSECIAVQEYHASGTASTTHAREVMARAAGDENLVANGQYYLAMILLLPEHPSEDACREARSILEGLLQRPKLSMVQQHVYSALLVRAIEEIPGDGENAPMAQAMRDRIWAESEANGGQVFRRANWSINVWTHVIGSPATEQGLIRWLAYEEAMANTHGAADILLGTKLVNALYLLKKGEYQKALERFLHCISVWEFAPPRGEDYLHRSRDGAAVACIRLKRFGEAKVHLSKGIKARLEEPEVSWANIDKLVTNLSEALRGEEDRNARILVSDLRLAWQEQAPSQGTSKEVTERHVDALAEMFYAKQTDCICHPGRHHFDVDEVVGHLDEAISAFAPPKPESTPEPGGGSTSGTGSPISPPSEPPPPASSPPPGPPTYATGKICCWPIFELLVDKAIYLSKRREHHRAAEAFALSRVAFESVEDTTTIDKWRYMDGVLCFLSWSIVAPPGLINTASAISWLCIQARRCFGDNDATRAGIRERIIKRPRLRQHIAVGDAYTDDLRAPPPPFGPVMFMPHGIVEVVSISSFDSDEVVVTRWVQVTSRLRRWRRIVAREGLSSVLAIVVQGIMHRSKQKARRLARMPYIYSDSDSDSDSIQDD